MLFTAIFVCKHCLRQLEYHLIYVQIIHLIFSWSSVISWLMFVGDLILIGFLAMHAYRDGEIPRSRCYIMPRKMGKCNLLIVRMAVDSLEHYEVPFFGRLANSFVDDE